MAAGLILETTFLSDLERELLREEHGPTQRFLEAHAAAPLAITFTTPGELAAGMPALVCDLETVLIERCGHWTQQEKPAELNRILVDWLSRRMR